MINIIVEEKEYPNINKIKKIDKLSDYCQICNTIYKLVNFEYICKKHRICNLCYTKLIKIHRFDTDLFIGITPECPVCKDNFKVLENLQNLQNLQNIEKKKCSKNKKCLYSSIGGLTTLIILIIILIVK